MSEIASNTVKREPGVRAAWLMGAIGLVPFAVGVVGIWAPFPSLPSASAALALVIYATVVLAFLGGVRWGADLNQSRAPGIGTLTFALLPGAAALVLCAILPVIGLRWCFAGLIGAFALQAVWDLRSHAMPAWAGQLRAMIILGGLTGMLAGLIGS